MTQVDPNILLDAQAGTTMPTEEEIEAAGGVEEAMTERERLLKRQRYQQAVAALNVRSKELHNQQMQALEFAKKAVVRTK